MCVCVYTHAHTHISPTALGPLLSVCLLCGSRPLCGSLPLCVERPVWAPSVWVGPLWVPPLRCLILST